MKHALKKVCLKYNLSTQNYMVKKQLWSNLQKQLKNFLLCNLTTVKLKMFLKLHYLKTFI